MFVVLDNQSFPRSAGTLRNRTPAASRIEANRADTFSCIVAAEGSLHGWIGFVRRHGAGWINWRVTSGCTPASMRSTRSTLLPFDREAALIFHSVERQRLRAGTMDLEIAAICVAHDATLLSRNLVDFEKVPGLRVENWLD